MNKISIILSTQDKTFIDQYQTLIGSLIGVFGAAIVALVSVWFSNWVQSKRQIRENIRLLEITTSVSAKNLIDVKENLNLFIDRINNLVIEPLESGYKDEFCLSKTNFPIINVEFNPLLTYARFKSYYIHNKVLIISTNISNVNNFLNDLSKQYNDIYITSTTMISLGTDYKNQRYQYLITHKAFIEFIKNDLIKQLDMGLKEIAQLKIQNRKHLEKKWFEIWKMERADFKYFRNKNEMIKFTSEIDLFERIESSIDHEVKDVLKKIENGEEVS